jgi:hypothetical protein
LSSFLTIAILIRFYHFFRLINSFSIYNSLKSKSACKTMNCEADSNFILKTYLKTNPFLSLSVCVFLVIILFGMAEQIFEWYNRDLMNQISYLEGDPNAARVQVMNKFANVYNSFWLVLVTITTIGYGDIYPTTYAGRMLSVFACISGTFMLSLLVVFMNEMVQFDDVEKQVFNQVLEESNSMKSFKKDACNLIIHAFKYNYYRKKMAKESALYRFYLLYIEMRFLSREFKEKRM